MEVPYLMNYEKFISIEDVKKRGYDLMLDGRLNQGDFATIEAAAADFLQECFDSVYNLIETYKGPEWTELFFEDMANQLDPTTQPKAYRTQQALKWAILEQTIFIYDNGDVRTSAKIEIDKIGFSPKAADKLWKHGLLG